MSYRMDNWLANTGAVGGNYLVNSTGISGGGGCGNTTQQVIGELLGAGFSFGAMAIAAKQSNATQGASNVNAMTLAHTALAQAGVVDTAILEYDNAKKELDSLETRQKAVKDLRTLEAEVKGFEGNSDNQATLKRYTELNQVVDDLTALQSKAETIESEMATLELKANVTVNTQLPNAFTTITGDGSDAVAQVEGNKSAYGEGDSFNSVAYNQDVSAAREIQTAVEQKKIAQKQLENKKQELQALKNQPSGTKIQGEVSSATIKDAIAAAKSELNQFALDDNNTLKNGNATMNLVAYNDKLGAIKKAKADEDVDFDAKINAQKTVVATKRKAVLAQKATLQATRNDLARLAQSMQNVITEQGEADAVKTTRDNYNKTHKRGFFKKLFGTGKDATQKANDKSYKKEKSEAKAASATFAQAYSFKADAAGLQTINDALREIDAKLAKIATIEAEAEV